MGATRPIYGISYACRVAGRARRATISIMRTLQRTFERDFTTLENSFCIRKQFLASFDLCLAGGMPRLDFNVFRTLGLFLAR